MAFSLPQTDVAVHRKRAMTRVSNRLESWLEVEREQIGLWVPIALGAGISAWFILPNQVQWAAWLLLCCIAMLGSLLLPDGGRVQRAVQVLALLAAVGCMLIWGKALLIGQPPIARPAFVEVTGRVVRTELWPAQNMVRLTLAPEPVRIDLPRLIRVNVAEKDMIRGIGRGALIRLHSRLMPPAPPAVHGGYDFARNAYFSGIGATGRAVPPIAVIEPVETGAASLRQRLSAHIRAQLDGGSGAIAATLATGDLGAISKEDAEAMRGAGLAHLLSISGLHVSAMIGAVIFMVYRLLALSRRLALGWPLMAIAAAAGALTGVGYTILTGAEVPTIRSCVAALLVLGGLAMGRDSIGLRLVATGAIVVLLFWPEALIGPSFQMSFLAVTVLVALAEARWYRALTAARDEGALPKAARSLLGLFLTGLAVECALMPVALYHFHQSGLYGALANLVAIPLTTFVVMPTEALALLLDVVGWGEPLWWVVGHALGVMLVMAHWVAAQPGAVMTLPIFAPVAFGLCALGMFWLLLWRSRVRIWGILPILVGAAAMIAAPAPDILVTGDGRHMALRQPDGHLMLLRGKAGDYVRDALGSAAGEGGQDVSVMRGLEEMPDARCNADTCTVLVRRGDRQWRLLATRSRDRLPWRALVKACGAADIVVSDRRLPRACVPRWLKLDRTELRQSGGVAIYLEAQRRVNVRTAGDTHRWVAVADGTAGAGKNHEAERPITVKTSGAERVHVSQ